MKTLPAGLLPKSLVPRLQRLALFLKLLRPYHRMPFSLDDVPRADLRTAYAGRAQKQGPAFKKIMRKLRSFAAAGPVGPNKYWEYPWILSTLDLRPGLRVLDAGCGRAPVQYALADLGLNVSAIDPFENVGWHGIDRRLAKKFGLNIEYRVEGMERISFGDGTFDRVVSASVLEHCRTKPVANELAAPQTAEDRALQAQMMREMARVLKKGGLLVVTLDMVFPQKGAVLECNVNVRNLIDAAGIRLLGPLPAPGVYGDHNFRMEDLERLSGLDVQDYQGVVGTSLGLVFKKG
jgi:ubiquinone/menaquinone biosynthesis C-methylase UbiE